MKYVNLKVAFIKHVFLKAKEHRKMDKLRVGRVTCKKETKTQRIRIDFIYVEVLVCESLYRYMNFKE
jgi:hypothetical protein